MNRSQTVHASHRGSREVGDCQERHVVQVSFVSHAGVPVSSTTPRIPVARVDRLIRTNTKSFNEICHPESKHRKRQQLGSSLFRPICRAGVYSLPVADTGFGRCSSSVNISTLIAQPHYPSGGRAPSTTRPPRCCFHEGMAWLGGIDGVPEAHCF